MKVWIGDENILTFKVPFDPQVFVTGQDSIGQIIIHEGPHSTERKGASLALYLYIFWVAFL